MQITLMFLPAADRIVLKKYWSVVITLISMNMVLMKSMKTVL